MGSYSVMVAMTVLLTWFCFSSALDMSIMNYESVKEVKGILRSAEEMAWLYEEWLVRFDKSYDDLAERERRFAIFKDNLRFIDEHNHPSNNHTYTVGLNHLADLTNEEYREKYLNQWINTHARSPSRMRDENVTQGFNKKLTQLPASVDWRTTGAVGPVINQGECGSCWAWTAVAAVEALHQMQTGRLILLSAQQLVDCERISQGCDGGYVDKALNYIARNRGVDTKDSYPYIKKDGQCKPNSAKVVSIDSVRAVISMNEQALQAAIAGQPVGIAVEARGRDFQLYSGGIFNGQCGILLDHAMLAVGYGTENGQDYWLIKNTYGPHYGEDGYIRMQRNIPSKLGQCGITSDRSYYPVRRQGP